MASVGSVSSTNTAKGLTYGLTAYLIWGSFPIIISSLGFATPVEVVVWRVVFGFLAAVFLITVNRSWGSVRSVLASRSSLVWILVSAVFIMVNWQAYVIGIASGHVVESSLGYFINPIVTIVLAVVFLGERLRVWQWVAVGIAFVAVDEAMRDTAAGLEACGIPWPEHGLALVLPQDQFAFKHVDELVLLFVPVAQCRGRACFDARDIDAELGQGHRIADSLLFASRDHRSEFFRIGRDLLRRNFFDLDLGHLLPHLTAANDRNPSIHFVVQQGRTRPAR